MNKAIEIERERLRLLQLAVKGGPGSGNFGHAGRPGERGGSALGGGQNSNILLQSGIAKGIEDVWQHGQETGNEMLVIVDKNGAILSTTTGDSQRIYDAGAFDDSEAIISIHNHPSSASFSPEDMATFAISNHEKMVAVGHDGTIYILTKYGGRSSADPKAVIDTIRHDYAVAMLKTVPDFREKAKTGQVNVNTAWRDNSHIVVQEVAKSFDMDYIRIEPLES